jgi:uncharacterized membrane protein YgcG
MHVHFSTRLRRRVVVALAATTIAGGVSAGLVGLGSASAGILPTTTTVTATPSTLVEGAPLTLIATVGPLDLAVTPTGTVTFTAADGGTSVLLGISPTSTCVILLSTCTATLNTTIADVPNGTYVITATYSGDTLSDGSVGTTTIAVTGATGSGSGSGGSGSGSGSGGSGSGSGGGGGTCPKSGPFDGGPPCVTNP